MKMSYKIDELQPGMFASLSHVISDDDVRSFAMLSGDTNPVHLDDEYAGNSRFGRRIAHGLFSASFFSRLFGTELPGSGCVYTSQNLKFLRPVYIGDEVVATVTIQSVNLDKRRVCFATTCAVNGRTVINGDAEVYIP